MRTARARVDKANVRQKFQSCSPVPGEPEQPVPWYLQDPWEALDPCYEDEEPELPGIPVALPGPGSGGGGGPVSDSSSQENLGIDVGTLLAAQLIWRT